MATTTSQGKYLGSDASFKTRKGKSISSSLRVSAQRKDSLEKKAIDDKRNQEQAKAKEISRREKERQSMRKRFEQRVAEESNPNRNTDERRKVVNVGRPDTAKNPMDPRAKLVKQAEIKTKIIEAQEKTMSFKSYHGLPDDLVAAVRGVLEGKNPFAKKDDDKKTPKKDDDADDKDTKAKKDDSDDDDADDQDTKSSKKDSDDDDADREVGKGGKKTKVDVNPTMKMANEELKGGQKKLDKNHNGKLDAQDFKMLRKEEVEVSDSLTEDRAGYGGPTAKDYGYVKKTDPDPEKAKKYHDYYEHPNGNSYRIKGWGGDKIEFNRPNASNKKGDKKKIIYKSVYPEANVRHFNRDLEKEHGKVTKSPTTQSESVLSVAEMARIEAKLASLKENDDEKHEDGPEHIVMQLRKAKSLGAANRPIHFHDGSKVKVASGHVQKALDMHNSFKKAPDKDEFTQKLQASHASFKKAIGEEVELDEAEDLNELSKKTLQSYRTKAIKHLNSKKTDKSDRVVGKRTAGVHAVFDKEYKINQGKKHFDAASMKKHVDNHHHNQLVDYRYKDNNDVAKLPHPSGSGIKSTQHLPSKVINKRYQRLHDTGKIKNVPRAGWSKDERNAHDEWHYRASRGTQQAIDKHGYSELGKGHFGHIQPGWKPKPEPWQHGYDPNQK